MRAAFKRQCGVAFLGYPEKGQWRQLELKLRRVSREFSRNYVGRFSLTGQNDGRCFFLAGRRVFCPVDLRVMKVRPYLGKRRFSPGDRNLSGAVACLSIGTAKTGFAEAVNIIKVRKKIEVLDWSILVL